MTEVGAIHDASERPVLATSVSRHVYGEVRQDWLDWLRGVSILLVLFSHYQLNWRDAGVFRPLAQFNMRFGWSGVDMFFVISGFLVGGLLLREQDSYGRIDLRRFYMRRCLKIWPLLYATPLMWLPFHYGLGTDPDARFTDFWPILLHAQNYFATPLGHLWSLAVEEHFYLLLPVFVSCFGASIVRERGVFPMTLVVLMTTVALLRVWLAGSGAVSLLNLRLQTQYRLDAMLFGVLLTWLYQMRPRLWAGLQRWRWPMLGVAGLLLWPFVFNPNTSMLVNSIGLTSIYLSYGCMLAAVSSWAAAAPGGPTLRLLAWIGRYSFPIYLFHPFVWKIYEHAGFSPNQPPPDFAGSASVTWSVGFALFVLVSILSGALIGYWFEKPLLAVRNRLAPPRATALPGMPLPQAAAL